jgi:hypothetical protein
MDDRKYRQNGYQDTSGNGHHRHDDRRDDRPRHQGPKLPLDVTGPRLPRLVQAVTASRCFNCATTLPPGTDFKSTCPKCNAELHCCKQCSHFEPSTRFQCLKPIKERIAYKDKANECELFTPRVTVARDAARDAGTGGSWSPGQVTASSVPAPKSPADARSAFENLFKK